MRQGNRPIGPLHGDKYSDDRMRLKRGRSCAAGRGDDGAELIEFALVAAVFCALLVGGLFVLVGVIAKGQASSDISTAASFAAQGGCSTTPTTTCIDGSTPPLTCPATVGNSLTGPGGQATVATICEIEQIIGGTFFDTDPASLQVAIYCPGPGPMQYTVGISGLPCAGSQAVWICARAWDSNDYPAVVGPSWISSESEQIVTTTAAATTTTGGTTTTTGGTTTTTGGTTTTTGGTTTTTSAPASNLQFETYYPTNPSSGPPWSNTPNMNCGPLYAVTYEDINSDGTSDNGNGNPPTDSQSPYPFGATATVLGNTGTPPLTLTGYTFAAWCTTDNATDPTGCTGDSYAPGATFSVSDNVTLYAQWSA